MSHENILLFILQICGGAGRAIISHVCSINNGLSFYIHTLTVVSNVDVWQGSVVQSTFSTSGRVG